MFWRFPYAVFAMLIGIWCETQYVSFRQQNWILPVVFIIFLLFCVIKNKKIVIIKWVLFGICIGISYTAIYNMFVIEPIKLLNKRQTDVYAVVTEYPQIYDDNQRVKLKIITKKSKLNMKIPYFYTIAYLPKTDENLKPSDIVKTKLYFYEGSDDGGFDRKNYYSGENIHILSKCAYNPSFTIKKSKNIPIFLRAKIFAQNLKQNLRHNISNDDIYGFSKALLFGDTQDLPIYIKQDFQKAGLSHILAVSGMHIGFLVLFFTNLLGKKAGIIISCIALIIFIPMTGAPISVLRAVIMYIVYAFAFYIRRDNNAIHSICFAMMCILFINPYYIQSISFQLSFLATFGIILFNNKIKVFLIDKFKYKNKNKIISNIRNIFINVISCSISACIFTSPVMLFQFKYVSIGSTIANILTIGVFAVLFIFILIFSFFSSLNVFSNTLLFIIKILSEYVFFVSNKIGNIKGFILYWDNKEIKFLIILFYIFIILAYIFRKQFNLHKSVVICCFILCFTVYSNIKLENKKYEITLFDDGGQTITVSSKNKHFAVIDCAGTSSQNAFDSIFSYANWYNYDTIDVLILTSIDKTHARNIPQLIENFNIRRCIIPKNHKESELSKDILNRLKKKNITTIYWTENGEKEIQPKSLGISIIGGADKKLGVRMKNGDINLLTLHSFTPKMLTDIKIENCKNVILSNLFLSNDKRIPDVIKSLNPYAIYIPSKFSNGGKIENIKYVTTKKHGDIIFKTLL